MLIMQQYHVECVGDLIHLRPGDDGLNEKELSMFFTIFVMMQFWNMFNAKAFMTGKSAFYNIRECGGFMLIAAVILVGQIIIVEFGGKMFNVIPFERKLDWLIIIGGWKKSLVQVRQS